LVPVNIYSPEEYQGEPDVFIVFAKQMTLQDLLERSAHFFKPEKQYVFSGMNGMGHVEKLNKYFPKEHVLAGTCLIGTVLNKAGDVD
ncbi:ketopantoate reductase family protein, partial [[Ruminococcus] torques]|uniref:ketopantoate reductase family protein n=2 Tax=Bacillota TaxID=1239 RepID=UPI0022AA642E